MATRVAIDARSLQARSLGGVGRGLHNLLPILRQTVDIELLFDRRLPRTDVDLPNHYLTAPVVHRGVVWLQYAVPRWLRGFPGIFHCPFYGLPYAQPVPMLATIHDISFEWQPEWFPAYKVPVFRLQARHAARTARRILTVSEHERHQIIERYKIAPELVLVAPNAVDPVFNPTDSDGEVAPAGGRPYVVAMGGHARRRLDTSIAAWRLARRRFSDLDLVVVGQTSVGTTEAGLIVAGQQSASGLAAILRKSTAFLYPTEYESFGLPGLEALACGAPVIAARVGALSETLGAGALWVEAIDPEPIADAIVQLLEDREFALARRHIALEVATAAPSWNDSARSHIAAYAATAAG